MTDWKWSVKLLNIQLKIQLNYSHNFAQIRVGKSTIIDTSRANSPWEWRTLASTGHLQGMGLAGVGLPFDWRKTMLDWQQATRTAARGCTTYCRMHCRWERGWCTSPHIALVPPAWPKPCRMGHFFQAHQKELQLPEWLQHTLAVSKHRQCHWNATKNWGGGWERWIQQKSLPTQGNLLLLIRHYPFTPPLFRKGDSPNHPVRLERNRSSNKHGEVGSSTNRAGSSVTHSMQTVNQDGQHRLQLQPQARRAESYRSFTLEVFTLLSFSHLFPFG